MGIFIKRPLFLFCCVFLGASLVACALGGSAYKILALCVSLLACALFLILSFNIEKRKYGLIQTAIACALAALAFAVSFVGIDIPFAKTERFLGENEAVEFTVLGEEYSSRFSTRLYGILVSTDEGEFGARAYLTLDHEADYKVGERLFLVGNIERVKREETFFRLPEDVGLNIISTTDKDLIISEKIDVRRDFSISLVCAVLRQNIRDIFISRLDFDSAAMASGYLSGDCSLIAPDVARDFRRTGLSHLLAVSGLHLTVLLGMFEVILTGARVGKGRRCVIMTLLSLLLLFASAFTASACRSVLMLLCTYLCYTLSKDSDAPTALGVSGALMVLLSPITVGDIGFWLSFLSTFGLVTYLELFSSRYQGLLYGKKGALKKALLSVLSKIIGAIAVSLCANVFICIIFWLVFGEMSVIFPIANLFVGPMGDAYLVLSLLILLFGGIPYLGSLLAIVAEGLTSLMVGFTKAFSSLDFSVVSLRYGFAALIVVTSTIALFVLITVKLKRKIFLCIPPVAAVLSFCVCLSVFNALNTDTSGVYINRGNKDSLVLVSEGECVIVDVSDGTYSSLYDAYAESLELYTTEIEALVLTHYHARHIPSVDRFFRLAMVRSIYLPIPSDNNELNIMSDIIRTAVDNGVNYYLYACENSVEIGDEFVMSVFEDALRDGSDRKIISFAFGTDDGVLCYADSSWYQSGSKDITAHFISRSKALVLGAHGPSATEKNDDVSFDCPPIVVSSDVGIVADSLTPDISLDNIKFAASKKQDKVSISRFSIR